MASLGPGPVYSLPPTIGYDKHDQRKTRMPQYSFGARTKVIDKNIVPGPAYNVSSLTRYGPKKNTGYSMTARTFYRTKPIGPGPANYDLNKSPYVNSTSPPAYSMGRRSVMRDKNICPGPNAYDGSLKSYAPAYSIGMRTELKMKAASPGPACYGPGNLKSFLHKAPEYSLAPRTIIEPKSIGPGANAYDSRNTQSLKTAPAYSFGVRHSPKAPPMIVSCDKM